LESFLKPYVNAVTFGIDVEASLIIKISAFVGLISFLKILTKFTKEQTQGKETIRLVWQERCCLH
jgi:hypothetical protein